MKITKMKMYVGVASLLVAATAFASVLSTAGTPADALTMGSRRDCGYTDPIVDCGTTSTEELLDVYNRNTDKRNPANNDIQEIFHKYGIKGSDIRGETSIVKKGWLNTDGTIVVDNVVVAKNAHSLYRAYPGDGKNVSPLTIAGKTFYYGPVAGAYSLGADVFVFFDKTTGQFRVALQASCGNPIPATPTTPPKPQPVYACDSLKATKDEAERTRFKFTAAASAKDGAQVVSYNYDFGDGTKVTNQPATIEHSYNTDVAKTYTAKVTANVKITATGETKIVPGANCQTTVQVQEIPKVPVFKCESLKATKSDRLTYKFDATASATNATIKSYTFKFGDGNSKVVTTGATSASTTYTYADRAAKYTAEVVVTMSDGKTATSEACKVPVEITEKPVEKKPSIDIIKTVNGKEHINVPVGTEFTYEIAVRNNGNVVLKNAVVTDKAPNEVTLISASAGKVNGNEWTYTIPELKIGETKKFTITAKYEKFAQGVHVNNVCVDTPTIPGSPDVCDEATTETNEKIEVCDLTDKTIKKIDRSEFNEATMTTDLSKCAEVPTVPEELPKTGIDMFISGGLGIGSISAASYYWVGSRRNLLDTLLKK